MPSPNKLFPKKSPKLPKKPRSIFLNGEKTRENELKLNEKYRNEMRKTKKEEIRNDCAAQLEMLLVIEGEKFKRVELMKEEISKEVKETEEFLESVCGYCDDILKQYSPPEEKAVDKIVGEIRKEIQEVFDLFHSILSFDVSVTETPQQLKDSQDETKFENIENNILSIETEINENKSKQNEIIQKIAVAKMEIEEEKIMHATHILVHEKEIIKLEKKKDKLKNILEAPEEDLTKTKKADQLQKQITELHIENEELEKDIKKIQQLLKDNNIK